MSQIDNSFLGTSEIEKRTVDFMIDIETLDTKSTARVCEIACVMFDADTIYPDQFHHRINPFVLQDDRTISADTMNFWADVVKAPLSRFTAASGVLMESLSELDKWFAHQANYYYNLDLTNSRIWCKGTDFDINILRNAGWVLPVKYNNIRDMRTLKRTSQELPKISNLDPHDALSDCLTQIKELQQIIKCSGGIINLA